MMLKEILKNKGSRVWTVRADQTLYEALHLLVNQNIGALVVLNDSEEIVGIISERDIIRGCYFMSRELEETQVADLMTRRVITAAPEEDINQIMQVMTVNRIRHIPVVHEGELVGIISIGDVVKTLMEDSAHQIQNLKEFIYGPVL